MDWLTNEMLFYGGIGVAAITVLLTIIYFVASKFKALRIKTQLISEYGEADK